MSTYAINNNVYVSMGRYEQDVVELCQPISTPVNCPNSLNLFEQTSSDAELLSENIKSKFHTFVAKLLYLSKRPWPDILTAVSVLCSRVANPSTVNLEHVICIVHHCHLVSVMVYVFIAIWNQSYFLLLWCSFGIDTNYAGHINIKLFFTKQVVDSNDIIIRFCRTARWLQIC